jgi:hypothetical protein
MRSASLSCVGCSGPSISYMVEMREISCPTHNSTPAPSLSPLLAITNAIHLCCFALATACKSFDKMSQPVDLVSNSQVLPWFTFAWSLTLRTSSQVSFQYHHVEVIFSPIIMPRYIFIYKFIEEFTGKGLLCNTLVDFTESYLYFS